MLEILVIIWVVRTFSKVATEKGLNKVVWGIIGAASYYIPVLLMSLWIFPTLVINGVWNITGETDYMIVSVLLNLCIGALCCVIAFYILKNQPAKAPEGRADILDDQIDV